jgi:hypothetical protein
VRGSRSRRVYYGRVVSKFAVRKSLSRSLLCLITISAQSCPLPAPTGVSREMFGDIPTEQAQGAKPGANHGAPRPGGPRAAPDRRRTSPRGALTAVPVFASAPRVLAPEHRRRRSLLRGVLAGCGRARREAGRGQPPRCRRAHLRAGGCRGMPGLLLGARVRQQAAATPAPGPAAGAVRFCVRFFRLASTFPQFCSSLKPIHARRVVEFPAEIAGKASQLNY